MENPYKAPMLSRLEQVRRTLTIHRQALLLGVLVLAGAIGLPWFGFSAGADARAQNNSGFQGGTKSETQVTGTIVAPAKTIVVNLRELAESEATNPPVPRLPKTHPVMPVPEKRGEFGSGGAPAIEPQLAPLAPTGPSPSPISSFQALPDGLTFIPPDVHGAVGPNHLVTALNTQIRVQNRTGDVLQTLSTFVFWFPLAINSVSDPRVLYDRFNDRWMQTIIVDPFGASSAICVAVSQTGDPTGDWNLFKIDVDSSDTNWADFPSMGFNKDWIVVSVNMFSIQGSGFANARTLVCVKSNVYANTTPAGTFKFFDRPAIDGSTLQPAVTMDNTTAIEYFVNHDTSAAGTARIYTLTGPVGSEAMNIGPAVTSTIGGWTVAPNADLLPQLGTTRKIHQTDQRWAKVVYRNGSIWGCQLICLPAGGPITRTAVQWWQVTPAGVVTQMGRIDDPTGGNWFAFPSIAVNSANDVLIGYSRFSATQFPSANYAVRAGTDPPGTLRDDTVLKAGQSCYVKTFGGTHNRWGDYSMTVVDPVNDFDMWTIQQYADTATGCFDGSGRWGTWWGKISLAPTQADLTSFEVKSYDGGQFLEWRTSSETDNLGFNLYRDDRGKRTKLNSEIVAGSALVTGLVAPLSTGRNYGWWDSAPAASGTAYWLEEVDLRGESKWHGPVGFESVDGAPPSRSRAATLNATGHQRAQTGVTRPVERKSILSASSSARVFAPPNLASQAAVKISVKREGVYKVTQSELVAAGLPPTVDPRLLQLHVDGLQQAIAVAGEGDGSFDAADWVEFYGVGLDAASTDTRVYWLAVGTKQGLRISKLSAAGSAPKSGSFPYAVERKDRAIYFSALLNGEKENFFGSVIAGNPVDQTLTLQHVDTAAGANAIVEIAIQGVTLVAHSVNVILNGVAIGQMRFDRQNRGIVSLPVAQTMLVEGENVVRLTGQNGPSDVSLVDYIRITYQHTFEADGNALQFTANGGQPVTIGGFTNKEIRVFDVTQPNSVQELIGTIGGDGSSFAVGITLPGKGSPRNLLAIASGQINSPTMIRSNQPSSWRVPSQEADLLIIGPADLMGGMELLKQHRQNQGLSVSMVDIEDVYDEFSFGQRTPQALKDFLRYTATTWKKKPRFALFVGDASFDPRNYMGAGDFDFVPSKLIDTVFMETSSDDWFADFDGDGIPELALGRFPVRTAQEAALIVQKILAYEKSPSADSVLLVADVNDIYDFEDATDKLVSLLSDNIKANVVNRGKIGNDAAARSQILGALNAGQRIVNYIGHGNADQWRGSLLEAGDATSLTNETHLSLFVLMTCLNGYFNHPTSSSLAESMLKAPAGGAAVVWASTGQSGPFDQALANQEFFRLIFNGDAVNPKSLTIGEAAVRAKRTINDPDVRRTWLLFGDPSMTFK